MPKLRVHSFAISLDGYGAGPNQDLSNPLGVGGVALHEWAFATRTFRMMLGQEGGTTGIDDELAAQPEVRRARLRLGRSRFQRFQRHGVRWTDAPYTPGDTGAGRDF
jgi:hypothetical protein